MGGVMETVERGKTMLDHIKDGFSNFKGKEFRPGQDEAIRLILDSTKKVVVICAPTGSGKSLIGMMVGAAHEKACYLCSSKQLQRQLMDDFPEARAMMGRSNFACNQDPQNRNADLCVHTTATPCNLKGDCDYEVHKRAALSHPLQILNYHYFLTEGNYVGNFAGYPMIIGDEADVLEGLLTDFIELRLSKARLDSLSLVPPRYRTATAQSGLSSWREWAAEEGAIKIKARMDKLRGRITTLKPDAAFTHQDKLAVREYKSLEALLAKLAMFTSHMDESWIFQEQKNSRGRVDGWVFQPTWLTPALSQEYFFQHGDRFLFMSATFPPRTVLAQMVGLNPGDIDYLELPSTFPTSNRPVLLQPVANMSHKSYEEELPKLVKEICRILDKHPHERGVIHTVSWKLNEAIRKLGDPRFIFHNSIDKDEVLERFSESANGVFVSPSSTRGLDLPDDLCRFVIIAKAPFQSLGDKLVASRVYGRGLGSFWYRAICAQDLVQASGRGVRHKDDYCVTYLLDKQIERLVVDNQNLFPKYWMEAVDYA